MKATPSKIFGTLFRFVSDFDKAIDPSARKAKGASTQRKHKLGKKVGGGRATDPLAGIIAGIRWATL